MSGQSYVPEVLDRLRERLTYHWICSYSWAEGSVATQQFQRRVQNRWKPVFVFSNGKYDGDWFGDIIKSDAGDSDTGYLHKWGQSESGVLDLVLRFSKPGDLVCSPFLGSGTVARAALLNGRRFVGGDIDPEAVEITRARLGLRAVRA